MSVNFDRLSEEPSLDSLPIRMAQTNARSVTVSRLLLLSPALVLLAVPMLVGAHVATVPEAMSAVSEHPMAALQVLVGCLLWAALIAIPLTQALCRLHARRCVVIDEVGVAVTETTITGARSWTAPLASYRGIAHHVRTSVSGVRHELILVHPDPARNVLLTMKHRLTQASVDKAKQLLGLPEVPARAIYERPSR